MSIDVPQSSSAYLHIGDIITLFCEGSDSGFIGTLGLVDDRCVVRQDDQDHEQWKPSKMFRDSLFEVYPVAKYHAQSQYNKKKMEVGSISSGIASAADDGILQRLKSAAEKEREQNLQSMKRSLGEVVRYGQMIQLHHRKSQKFLSSSATEPAMVERNANKVFLDPQGGSGCWFCIEPFYKHCSHGDIVVIGDRIRLLAMPSSLGHLRFGPSDHKHELHVSCKTIAECSTSHEVNCLSEAHNHSSKTSWRVILFLDHNEHRSCSLKSGDVIRLFHVEQQKFLTLDSADKKKDRQAANQYNVFLRKTDQPNPTDALSPKGLWEVEVVNHVDPCRGSTGRWLDMYRFKNMATDMYLSFDVDSYKSEPADADGVKVKSVRTSPLPANTSYWLAPLSYDDSHYSPNTLFELDPCTIEQPENLISGTAFVRLKTMAGYVYGTKTLLNESYKYKCVLGGARPDQEAFHIMPVSRQEVWDLDFANDAFALLDHFQKRFGEYSDPDWSLFQLKDRIKLTDLLTKIIRFTASDYAGDINSPALLENCDKKRQKWIREQSVLEVVLNLLVKAGDVSRVFDGYNCDDGDHEGLSSTEERLPYKAWREVFHLLNVVVMVAHKGYRKNQDYIVKNKLGTLLQLIGKVSQIEETLTSLLTGHKGLLKEYLSKKFIEDRHIVEFLEMTEICHDPTYLTYLSHLCVSQGEAIGELQEMVCKQIVPCGSDSDGVDIRKIKSTLIQTRWEHNDVTGVKEIKLVSSEDGALGKALNAVLIEMVRDNTSDMNNEIVEFYHHQIDLFASMCQKRQYCAINSEIGVQLPVDVVLECMSHPTLKRCYKLRASFTRLMLNMHVDSDPQSELPAIRYARLYQNICETSFTACQQTILENTNECNVSRNIKDSYEKFRKTIQFVQKYLSEDAQLQHSQDRTQDKLTLEVVRLAKALIIFGFYSLNQLRDIASDLLNIFNNDAFFGMDLPGVVQVDPQGNVVKEYNFKNSGTADSISDGKKPSLDLTEKEKPDDNIVLQTKLLIIDILEYLFTVRLDYRIDRLLVLYKKSHELHQSAAEFDENVENLTKLFIEETFCEHQGWFDLDGEGNLKMLRILLSFAMHPNPSLVSGALRLLNRLFSQREELISALKTVQLLVSQSDVDKFYKVRREKLTMKNLVDKSELWVTTLRAQQLRKRTLTTETSTGSIDRAGTPINEEDYPVCMVGDYMDAALDKTMEADQGLTEGDEKPDAAMQRILENLKSMCEETTGVVSLKDTTVSPDISGQNLLRNMCIYETALDFLSIPMTSRIEEVEYLFQATHEFLQAFCTGNKENQVLLHDHIVYGNQRRKPICLQIDNPNEIETLCAIYKDNSELCDNVEESMIQHVLESLGQFKQNDRTQEEDTTVPRKLHTSFLKFLEIVATCGNEETKRKVAVELENSRLCFDDVLLLYNEPAMFKELIKLFHDDLNLSDPTDPLAYHIQLIRVMTCCVDGHINTAEIKCGSLLRLTDIHRILLRTDAPLQVRQAYLDFLTHCYVDTEAEVIEKNTDIILIQEIFDHMIVQVQYIIDNEKTVDADQYVISSVGKFLVCFIKALSNYNSPLYNKMNDFDQRLLNILGLLASREFQALVKNDASNRALKKFLSDMRVESKNFPDLLWIGEQDQLTAVQLTRGVVTAKNAGFKFMRQIKTTKALREDYSIERDRFQQVVKRIKEYLVPEVEAEASLMVDVLQNTHRIFYHGKHDPELEQKHNKVFLAKLVNHAKSLLGNKQMERLCARIFNWLRSIIQPIKLEDERSQEIRNKLIKIYLIQKKLEVQSLDNFNQKINYLRVMAEKKAEKKRKLLRAQEKLEKSGACELVIAAVVSDPSNDIFQEALLLANALLHKGNSKCQKSFLNYLKNQKVNCGNAIDLVASASEEFFRVLQLKFVFAENKLRSLHAQNENLYKRPHDYMDPPSPTQAHLIPGRHHSNSECSQRGSVNDLRVRPRSNSKNRNSLCPNQEPANGMVFEAPAPIRTNAPNLLAENEARLRAALRRDELSLPPEAALMEPVLRFLQLMCENHNKEAQLYLLRPNTKTNYNLVTQTLALLDVACGSTSGSLGLLGSFINEKNSSLINQILITLTEYCQGPCKENQTVLAVNETNGLDIIIALIQSKISPLGDPEHRPDLVLELRSNASKLLLALMESRTDALNAERILTTMNRSEYLEGLVGSIKDAYRQEECRDAANKSYKIKPIQVGHNIYILTKQLAQYDPTLARLLKLGDNNLTADGRECKFQGYSQRVSIDDDEAIDESLLYYAKYTANIEIAREDGELEQIVFPVPEICAAEYLSETTKFKIHNEVEPDPQGSKVCGFVERYPSVYMEMQWQKKLKEYGKLAVIAKNLKMAKLLSYFFAIVLNVMVALYFPFNQLGTNLDPDPMRNSTNALPSDTKHTVVSILSNFVWIGLCSLSLAAYRYNSPKLNFYVMAFIFLRIVLWLGFWTNFYLLSVLQLINKVMQLISHCANVGMFSSCRRASQSWYIQMYDIEFAVLLTSVWVCIIGLGGYPLCYALLLLDIVYREDTLQNVIRSVTRNWKSIAWTTLLALILVYEFAIVGHLFLKEDYPDLNDGCVVPDICTETSGDGQCSSQRMHPVTGRQCGSNSLCDSLANCIIYTIHCGLRNGGGIGDCLETVTPELTGIWWHYPVRVVFDLGFFFIIIVIVLNLIFGVIIDTFADLRSEKQEREDMLKNTCFICGLHRAKFENKTVTFELHVHQCHNLWNYFYFWIMLQEKKSTELTGPESYVFEMLNDPKRKLEWFPRLRTLSLDIDNDTDNEQMELSILHVQLTKNAEAVQSLANQLEVLKHHFFEMRKSRQTQTNHLNANHRVRSLGSAGPSPSVMSQPQFTQIRPYATGCNRN